MKLARLNGALLVMLALVLSGGCGPGADAERRADEEYLAGRFEAAYAGYRDLAGRSGDARLWAKPVLPPRATVSSGQPSKLTRGWVRILPAGTRRPMESPMWQSGPAALVTGERWPPP